MKLMKLTLRRLRFALPPNLPDLRLPLGFRLLLRDPHSALAFNSRREEAMQFPPKNQKIAVPNNCLLSLIDKSKSRKSARQIAFDWSIEGGYRLPEHNIKTGQGTRQITPSRSSSTEIWRVWRIHVPYIQTQ